MRPNQWKWKPRRQQEGCLTAQSKSWPGITSLGLGCAAALHRKRGKYSPWIAYNGPQRATRSCAAKIGFKIIIDKPQERRRHTVCVCVWFQWTLHKNTWKQREGRGERIPTSAQNAAPIKTNLGKLQGHNLNPPACRDGDWNHETDSRSKNAGFRDSCWARVMDSTDSGTTWDLWPVTQKRVMTRICLKSSSFLVFVCLLASLSLLPHHPKRPCGWSGRLSGQWPQ